MLGDGSPAAPGVGQASPAASQTARFTPRDPCSRSEWGDLASLEAVEAKRKWKKNPHVCLAMSARYKIVMRTADARLADLGKLSTSERRMRRAIVDEQQDEWGQYVLRDAGSIFFTVYRTTALGEVRLPPTRVSRRMRLRDL